MAATIQTGLRLPPELHRELTKAAEERDVSMNWLCVRLLTDGVRNLIPVDELLVSRPAEQP